MFKKYQYILIALFVFILGLLFYYFFREPTIVANYFGIDGYRIISKYINYFNSFPSFAHVFSFSILTWLILEQSNEAFSILSWSLLNIIFEIIQYFDLSEINMVPKIIVDYSLYGTYSHIDILAIFLAAFCAKMVMSMKNSSI
jgi:hypothetical protein